MRFADWLALREPADAAARAADLVGLLEIGTPARIADLGSGTGSMSRWLAPRLPGPQHWMLYDLDPRLLAAAAAAAAALPAGVGAETCRADVTRLTAADLAGASLVTASALLDVVTAAGLDRMVAACAGAGCPALLTLTVAGRVELTPADPLDAELAAAFDDHQRRGGLLGPDAADATVAAFARHGVPVEVRDSPWRLGPGEAGLTAAWLAGWVGAACEQRPELAGPAGAYLARRLARAAAGTLSVVVGHRDLLAGGR